MKINPNWPKELKEFIRDFEPAPYATLDDVSYARLTKLIEEKSEQMAVLKKEIQGMVVGARVMCPHEKMEVESQYHASDYYNKSTTDYTLKCYRCGAKLFEVTK